MSNPPDRNALILYLDFDGVLHHENVLWHPTIGAYLSAPDGYVLFQHSELLEKLLAPYPEIRIVLSTAWVRRYGCKKSAKNLRPSLRERVIGATFHSRMNEAEFSAMSRGMQVWTDVLRRNPKDWIALDDDDFQWPECCKDKYIRTNGKEGISAPSVLMLFRKRLLQMHLLSNSGFSSTLHSNGF